MPGASAGPDLGPQPEPRRYTLATTTPSPELIPVTPAFTNTPAAGVSRLPGRSQRPDPPGPTSWTRASTRPGASTTRCAYSPPAAPTPSASPVTWKPAAAPGPPSPARCAPSPG